MTTLIRSILISAAFWAAFSCLVPHAFAQGRSYSTVTTAAPTAGAFSSVLARSDNRSSCVVTNVGTSQGYCQAKPSGFTPSTSNSVLVNANGGQFACSVPGSSVVIQDEIDCTCASGTCAFVVNSTGQ